MDKANYNIFIPPPKILQSDRFIFKDESKINWDNNETVPLFKLPLQIRSSDNDESLIS